MNNSNNQPIYHSIKALENMTVKQATSPKDYLNMKHVKSWAKYFTHHM